MKFGAAICALHGVFAVAIAIVTPTAIWASQPSGQVAPVPTPQLQNTVIAPADKIVAVPTTQAPPAAPPASTTAPSTPKPKPKPLKKGPVDALKPGDFVWVAQDVYEGPMKIVVVLDIQRIYVFQNDKLIGFSTISSGKKGKETPTGFFTILQKNVDHKSNLYSNAPMPFMQRLTWDGIAIHGGYLPGYPASHGCIRLPLAFAKALFGITQMDQEVFVLKDIATPVKRPEPKPVGEPSLLAPSVPLEDASNAQPAATSKAAEIFPPEPST
jgi:lipoprotein-anchoring transpeptidase ErfK/SrfK